MAENQVYLIKSGENSFVEETQAIVGISGGKVGIGTTHPEADLHVTGSVKVGGDLTVDGTLTTINSTTVSVDDINIELGSTDNPTDATAEGGGITVKGDTDKTFNWYANGGWTSSENLSIADGKHFAGDELRALDSAGLKLFDNNASGITVKAGKVGVHSPNPTYDLDVVGSGNFGSLYVGGNSVLTGTAADLGKWSDGSPGEIYYNGGNVGINTNDPAYTLDVSGSGNFGSLYVGGSQVLTSSDGGLGKWTEGSTAGEIYYTGGNVGIATNDPAYTLDVAGGGNFASLTVQGNNVLTGSALDLGKWEDAATAGEIYYTGGNVGIATNDPAYTLDVAGGGNFTSLTVQGNNVLTGSASDLGKWEDAATAGEIYYNGGNVGINTANPSTTLDVNGSLNVEGSFTVRDEFDFGSNGAVGGVSPAAVDDIIKWNGEKWVAGPNPGGAGAGGGEVPSALINGLISGQSVQSIAFLDTYDTAPRIATELEIDGEGSIIPYVISGVSTTGYNLIFSQEIPNNNYKIHTVFGGKDVYWETGASNSLSYNDGDVSLQRNLTIGGNLTVNGTQTIVNTETVEIEDHNLVIGANTHYTGFANPYPGAGDAYAGILWGTGDAGAASSVGLTYQSNKGFAFEGGNVGIGTTSPSHDLTLGSATSAGTTSARLKIYRGADDAGQNLEMGYNHISVTRDVPLSSNQSTFSINQKGSDGERTAMIISSAGNVGIGTTNPARKLEVVGGSSLAIADFKSDSHQADSFLYITNTSTPVSTELGSSASLSLSLHNQSGGKISAISTSDYTTNGNSNCALAFSTALGNSSIERMRITSTGNVGIGTTDPDTVAHIAWDRDVNPVGLTLEPTNWNAGELAYLEFQAANLPRTRIGSTVSASGHGILTFETRNTSSVMTERMRIDELGNVGIGTTNPAAKLDLQTSGHPLYIRTGAGANDNLFVFENPTAGPQLRMYEKGTSNVAVKLSTHDDSYFNGGNVGIGTTNPDVDLHLKSSGQSTLKLQGGSGFTCGLIFTDSGQNNNGAIYYHSDNYMRFNTAGTGAATEKMRITSSGNVGIGTTSPNAKLDVKSLGSGKIVQRFQTDNGNSYSIMHIGGGGASDIKFSVNGSGDVFAAGNVGIGTTNPTNGKLEILNPTATVATTDSVDLAITQNASGTSSKVQLRAGVISGDDPYFSIRTRNRNDASSEPGVIKERMRINHAGNVGIGTTNPNAELEVNGQILSNRRFMSENSLELVSDYNDNGSTSIIAFKIDGQGAGNEKMRITSNGNVGIGTTNPAAKLELNSVNTITTADTGLGGFKIQNGSSSVLNSVFIDGRTDVSGATDYTNKVGLAIFTQGNERMRITSAGNVAIGTANPGTNRLQVMAGANTQPLFVGSDSGSVCTMNRDTTDGHVLRFEKNGVLVGHISTNSNSLPSDRNFKRNITDLKLGLDFVNKLKPSVYNYKIDDEDCPVHYGLIAQDVESALEECGVEKNSSLMLQHSPTEKEEESDYSLDYGKLVPVLAKAIQEQQQLIEQLKSQNESLAARISALES